MFTNKLLLLVFIFMKTLGTNLTIQSIDSVDWDADFSWSTEIDGDDGKIEMDVDFTCYVNYNSFPLRIHCTAEFGVGYEANLDAKMTVQFGAEIRWDQLENIETEPEIDFYFAFTSPEISWDWDILGVMTYVSSESFPSTDGYYVKTVAIDESAVVRDGKSWEVNVCATLFGDLIPNEAAVSSAELAAIKAVAESAELSGSDLCITMVITPTGQKSVDLDILASVYALDETRVDWDNIPSWLEDMYTLVQCPSIEDWKFENQCATPEGSFEYLRELITGMDQGYHKEIDLPTLISDFIEEQKEFWENVVNLDKTDPDYQRYIKTSQNAGPLLTSTGSIRLGSHEGVMFSFGGIFAIAMCTVILAGMTMWMVYTKKRYGELRSPIHCCHAGERDIEKGHVATMREQYEGNYKAPLITDSTFCIANTEGIEKGRVADTVRMFEEYK